MTARRTDEPSGDLLKVVVEFKLNRGQMQALLNAVSETTRKSAKRYFKEYLAC